MKKKRNFRLRHLILLLVGIYIIAILFNQKRLMGELSIKKAELEEEIVVLKKDINGLEKEIENSDSVEFIEKIAREELGMVKPREIIYIDKDKVNDDVIEELTKENN